MQNKSEMQLCQIGIVGLGVMGRNLLLNMADHGFKVAGYDQDTGKVKQLLSEGHNRAIQGATSVESLIALLDTPRILMLLVPAGQPVDSAINALVPFLDAGDLIVDGGNSYFTDTSRRELALQKLGIHYLGLGISGGEKGARQGPSLMPGGSKEAYERIRPILEAIAAKVKDNSACVTYLGKGSAGHYVKMVHNGIEYGIMQLIAEIYDLLKRGLGLSNEEISSIFAEWNKTELNSYLLEITSCIFAKKDDETGEALIDLIRGVAKQKGTGLWTSQNAIELQVAVPIIDAAVAMRNLSGLVEEREAMHQLYQRPTKSLDTDTDNFVRQLQSSLLTAIIIIYAQGLALLKKASQQYDYALDLEAVAKVWRGGCIIRAQLLEEISSAFLLNPQLSNLLLDPSLAQKVFLHQENLREVLSQSILVGIPVPGLMSTLTYLDQHRSAWLPTNLIQAQRDCFGAHTYERQDKEGVFHTEWVE